jgi:AsmA-like protein
MFQLNSVPDVNQKKNSRFKKGWFILFSVLLAGVAVAAILLAVKWPFTRQAMIQRLEKASGLKVEFGSFHGTYFPPGCIAECVVFHKRVAAAAAGQSDSGPLLTIGKLEIQGSYPGLFSHPKRIQRIVADAAHIQIPQGGAKLGSQSPDNGNQTQHAPRGQEDGKQNSQDGSLIIQEFRARNAVVEIASKRAGGKPLVFEIRDAVFRGVASDHTVPFSISMRLPLPPGDLEANGWIGPWRGQQGKARSTPVSGSIRLQRANLGVFKSLGGSISSHVNFSGTLEKLNVSGETDSPDFEVKESGHRIPLSTRFSGSVDLITGDVSLPSLRARLGGTSLVADARIAGYPKRVELNVTKGEGEVQDLILLFSKAPRSPIKGPIQFHTKIVLPPERRPFKERVRLAGDFKIDPAHFTSAKTQGHVDQLSERARGQKDKDKDTEPDLQVLSDLKGHVALENGVANFAPVSFSVPGATANMHGTYNLTDKHVNLSGKMRMQAKVSEATKGAKSFFLKLLDPIFKKKGVGAEVPVSMTGAYGHTHFSAGLK